MSVLCRACCYVLFSLFLASGCTPSATLPPVHEPIDSPAWQQCAGELAKRESIGMIDDLTLDAKTLLCQGVTLAASGKVDEGLEMLTESGVRDKEDHRPHYMAGRILVREGRYEEAISAFKRSATRFPSIEVPAERMGRRLMEEKGTDAAMRFLSIAMERGLCRYGCQGLIAKIHQKTGDTAAAEAMYRKMIAADPGEPSGYVGLAGIKNAGAKYREEATLLRQAKRAKHFGSLNPNQQAGILYSLAFAEYNVNEHTHAAGNIAQAIALQDDRADWYVLAGWIDLKRTRYETALAWFEKAQARNAGLSAAYQGAGDARIALNQLGQAESAYQMARDRDPTSGVIALKLAHVAALQGDKEKAKNFITDATRLDAAGLPADLMDKVTSLLE
ncbi:MAG: tetratricopeptide repeat protein [Myxococcota bacterium]|nr:tetratricopeptide repeat protein [Myxococcota bacterium]